MSNQYKDYIEKNNFQKNNFKKNIKSESIKYNNYKVIKYNCYNCYREIKAIIYMYKDNCYCSTECRNNWIK